MKLNDIKATVNNPNAIAPKKTLSMGDGSNGLKSNIEQLVDEVLCPEGKAHTEMISTQVLATIQHARKLWSDRYNRTDYDFFEVACTKRGSGFCLFIAETQEHIGLAVGLDLGTGLLLIFLGSGVEASTEKFQFYANLINIPQKIIGYKRLGRIPGLI